VSPTTAVPTDLVAEVVETLERVGCQFDFCDGPTLDPVPMGTCYRCETLAKVRVAAGLPPRDAEELTASERINDRLARYMASAVPS
jgi:hypothetical protein